MRPTDGYHTAASLQLMPTTDDTTHEHGAHHHKTLADLVHEVCLVSTGRAPEASKEAVSAKLSKEGTRPGEIPCL